MALDGITVCAVKSMIALFGLNCLDSGIGNTALWALIQLGNGETLLLTERTYRAGVCYVRNPDAALVETARTDPWSAWNDERMESMNG